MLWTRHENIRFFFEKCDHHTVKRFVSDSAHTQVCGNNGRMWKVSARQVHRIKRAADKKLLQNSKQIFEAPGAFGVLQACVLRPET